MKTSVVAKNATADYILTTSILLINLGMYKICTYQETELLLC